MGFFIPSMQNEKIVELVRNFPCLTGSILRRETTWDLLTAHSMKEGSKTTFASAEDTLLRYEHFDCVKSKEGGAETDSLFPGGKLAESAKNT